MPKVDYIEFQTRTQPHAFLITFRTYGTWLHGDERGAVDRRKYHTYGMPAMPPNQKLQSDEQASLRHAAITLSLRQREVVELAIREVCEQRAYALHAINVRTNHVHSVVSAACKPAHVMEGFKAYATRKLRAAGLIKQHVKPWARHGSTRYLWTEEQANKAIGYVIEGQGLDLLY